MPGAAAAQPVAADGVIAPTAQPPATAAAQPVAAAQPLIAAPAPPVVNGVTWDNTEQLSRNAKAREWRLLGFGPQPQMSQSHQCCVCLNEVYDQVLLHPEIQCPASDSTPHWICLPCLTQLFSFTVPFACPFCRLPWTNHHHQKLNARANGRDFDLA
jgi:hypothetical protein